MSSAWPPQLKAWVQESLAKATPASKTAVNEELRKVLLNAHTSGTINTTDWSKVELQSLKAQAARTTHVPMPVYTPPAPPVAVNGGSTLANHYISPAVVSDVSPKQTKKNKKQKKNDGSTSKSFPTPYHFTGNDDSEALARRAARFQPAVPTQNTQSGMGMSAWFGDSNGASGSGSSGLGMVPGQVGRGKMKGKGVFRYGSEEVVEVDPNVIDWDKHTIRGTSTKLEKSYLRLTSEPSPADIRPLHILKETLQLLKRKWKENHNYAYALDQFKSMRQDLTVQRIKNEFTVEVYEIHARIALEAKDLGEYNQCQTMLRQLYELGLPGHPQEFLSYRIIYLLHTRNRSDMAALLAQLTPTEKSDPGVHHALQVHASLATSNYVRFFRLYNSAPNMSGYIMDHFIERERMTALTIMSKAYMTLTLPYLTTTLAFDADSETDDFLASHNAAVYTNATAPPAPAEESGRNRWKPIKAPPPTPLHERIWDCKKAHAACAAGMNKYRVVDLKGQVD